MKKILALILALCMIFTLAACGEGPAPGQSEDPAPDTSEPVAGDENDELEFVGLCFPDLSTSIYNEMDVAIKAIFEGKADVQTVSCDQDVSTQISQIRNFVLMGADLIYINPVQIEALADVIAEAHDAGCKVYINGATSDNIPEEHYDCCSVSDEYLMGAYVAMIAKNWIETHVDQLDGADGDWELSFLEGTGSEDAIKRSRGIQSILEPYLKDWEGNYIDAMGNPVDEANKVENPAYCQLAVDHFNGVKVEQDMANSGMNVANILTTNPNTRVFMAYTSAASVQGGQYVVDNYPDEIDNFAFFSAGVLGNEADYIVGSLSETDGVRSAMRGAVQFGVSAAGGEVAVSVANTCYAILYGEEGVDYTKTIPEGIAAWWASEAEWNGEMDQVAHFNILSGVTVQAFDPVAALKDSNTVLYWNEAEGFVENAAAAENEPAAQPGEGESYTYSETNGSGIEIDWTLTLGTDGTYTLTEVNMIFPDGKTYEGTTYSVVGGVAVCGAMVEGPAQFEWADPAGFTATLNADGTFTPGGEAPSAFTYNETNGAGIEIDWTLTLNDDGTYTLSEVNMIHPDGVSYEGTGYTMDGSTVVCAAMTSGPEFFEWADPAGFTVTLNDDGTFTPSSAAPSEYTYNETNGAGIEIDWTLTLNDDGTYTLSEVNMIHPDGVSYEGTGYTMDGSTVVCAAMTSGPEFFEWADPAGFTVTLNDDGTFTPVV